MLVCEGLENAGGELRRVCVAQQPALHSEPGVGDTVSDLGDLSEGDDAQTVFCEALPRTGPQSTGG